MSKKIYPPENVELANEKISDSGDPLRSYFAETSSHDFQEVERIYQEFMQEAASLIMDSEFIGTYQVGSGFPAVDPAHFRKVENTRLHHFFKYIFNDPARDMLQYELSLMIQEIKDLRAVLQHQFHYDWTHHRSMFPLIAQHRV